MPKAPSTRSRKSGKGKGTVNSVSSSSSGNEGLQSGKPQRARRVHWNPARTERLLDWLDENPEERQKLFSDSSKDAKDEGRRKRQAKSPKSEFHKLIAAFVFSVDSDSVVRADFRSNPANYTKSVDNYIIRLRKEYRSFNEKLGQTGAGLRYEDLDEGSDLKNLVEQLQEDFPYWKRLHGFWRTLPNFNPFTASSDPGQDLGAEALAFIQHRGTAQGNDDNGDAPGSHVSDEEFNATPDEPQPREQGLPSQPATLDARGVIGSCTTPVSEQSAPSSFPNTSSRLSTPFSRSTATTSSQKGKGKRAHVDAFSEENKVRAQAANDVTLAKHDRRMAEHSQRMAELDIKKRRLEMEDMEKRLEAERSRLAAVHQREREKEQHDMEMLRLRLQYQGVGGSGVSGLGATGLDVSGLGGPFDAENQDVFPTPNPFGSLG